MRIMNSDTVSIPVLPFIIALVLAAGCSAGFPERAPPEGAGTINPSLFTGNSSPDPVSVYITYPDFDGGVAAENVTVTVLARNFSVVNRIGRQNSFGEGHFVYFMDAVPPTTPGLPVATQPGTFQISDLTWCTWYNVSPGTHTFAVELVNNDNTPLIPAVIDAVDVTAVPDRVIS